MKINKKKWLVAFLGIIFCSCITFSIGIINENTNAYALTNETPKYSMQFDYERKTSNGTSTSTATGTGYSVSVQTSQYSSINVSVVIFGSSASGTDTFPIGGYINSSTVNIQIVSSANMGTISVKNSAGTSVGTKNGKALTLTGLADGKYNVSLYLGGGAWATSLRSGISVNVNATTSFIVDSTKPTITGASTSTTGKYTNSHFTVSAADNVALDCLYYKKSGGSSWIQSGTKFTANEGTSNGLYCFYATDKAGNSSSTYYVYYDSILPTGSIKNASGTKINGGYTNKSFQYWGEDSGSGINSYQYKTPTSSAWQSYTGSTLIPNTSTNGVYKFRTLDKAGNYSAESSIILDTTVPKGILYGGTKTIESGGITNANFITFGASDVGSGIKNFYVKKPSATAYENYYIGSQFAAEGTYSFYCIDYAGNSSITYTITLDKTPPKLICNETSFNSIYGAAFTVKVNNDSDRLFYINTRGQQIEVVGSSVTIGESSTKGKYYFYAKDAAGNVSETVWIDLQISYPTAQVLKSTTDNSVCIIWTDSTCSGKLNGSNYLSGTWIKPEGSYTFIITNKYGQTNSYSFTIDHNYIVENVIGGSCTEDGYTTYKCTSCGRTYNGEYKLATGHKYETTVNIANCTEGGFVLHKCSVCGDEHKTDEISALGHIIIESIIPTTCEEDGCVRHSCSRCGFSYDTDVTLATGHSYSTEVDRLATCTKDGLRRHVCDNCADEYETVIPATGHNMQLIKEETVDGITTRTYKCTECGEEQIENIGNQYEKVSNYVEYLFKQYQPYMWWVLLATTGVWSLAIGISIIIAHKNEDKEKARKMLVNYVIGLVVIFAIVVACPYLVRGIAILVT